MLLGKKWLFWIGNGAEIWSPRDGQKIPCLCIYAITLKVINLMTQTTMSEKALFNIRVIKSCFSYFSTKQYIVAGLTLALCQMKKVGARQL